MKRIKMIDGLVKLVTDESFHLSNKQLMKKKSMKKNENTNVTIV